MKKGFKNNHVGAESFSARLHNCVSSGWAEKDSAPTIRKRSPRRDDLNKSSLLRTPSSSLPLYSVGFTLIELLVVVLIIAILAAVALPQYTTAVEKSRATEALINARAFAAASERYKLAADANPTSFAQLDISMPNTTTIASNVLSTGKFAYTIDTTNGNVCVRRINNATASTWNQEWYSICYWYQQDTRSTSSVVGPGSLTCTVRTADAKAAQAKKLCLSLGGAEANSVVIGSSTVYKLN
ncbi:prepilin-type N-terminal cleavage/methylation domain-containing protein [Parelusimicrobium proximum]|uniref:type IV pilin protein n=1 Tax=Parelusimicrobium proximum TaxID=3228953 RepID=UPI003D16B73E